MPSVKLLGFILSQEGISQDPEKTSDQRLSNTINSNSSSGILRASFILPHVHSKVWRRFQTSAPYLCPERSKKKFQNHMGVGPAEGFRDIEGRLTTFPCLAYFKDELETFVHCDASSVACGAVLAQKHGGSICKSSVGSSRENLSHGRKRGALYRVDLCEWRSYLVYREVTIVTDQKSLTWLFSLKTPNEKLMRYAVGQNPSDAEDVMNAQVMTLEEIDMRVEQQSDKFCGDLISFLEGNTQNSSDRLKRLSTGFYVDDGFDMAYPVREQLDPFIMDTADRFANIQAFIKYNIAEKKRYSEALANETRRPVTLKVGDKCLLFSPMRKADQTAKLTHFFTGPYEVLEQTSPVNFRISYNRPGETKGTIINVARLKQWHDRQVLEQEVVESSDQKSAEVPQRKVIFKNLEASEETVESDPQSQVRKELPASLKPKEVAKCTFCNKPVIGPWTKGTIIGGKPTMKHANEFDGRFCAARRRAEVAQNSESTEEVYFIPEGRKVATINEIQPPQIPATNTAVAPIVELTQERENSPEFPVQQPRRTTPFTTSRTTNIRPARKQRREGLVSESGEEQVSAGTKAEEYANPRNSPNRKEGGDIIGIADASDQKKPCDYESITKNDGYLYDLENKRLRVRDPERQVDFILDAQPADMDCNFTTKVYHVRGGFSDVLLSVTVVNTTVIENELSEAQR
ncbi:hypothetical protein BV898_19725 [Hypsibius exemplaris]|uniref:Reverse transcriptase RNase H-like domain-containing protein n=1 Tax=Hypsibius exemplaris TaxID=2072580 RepID=A0A9X6RQ15_HYPEX|nr:hypothetical protein BV898_19725 [Hypsibius exemplaris]